MSDKKDPYKVGYGKPPKYGQFKPGQSGNPKGRKKGSKSLRSTVSKILNERVTVQIGNRTKRLTKMEAMVHRILNGALSGDASATREFMKLIQTTDLNGEMAETVDAHQAARLTDEDRAILKRYMPNYHATLVPGSSLVQDKDSSVGHDEPDRSSGIEQEVG